jgi:hypothetical protein
MLLNGHDGMVTHPSLTAGATPAGAVRVPSRTWSSSFTAGVYKYSGSQTFAGGTAQAIRH